ncbi:flavin monoamine oxidase family protein [Algoriphagus namhaensis]
MTSALVLERKSPSPEVVIVGAGFSGIAAAKKLHEAGLDFIVLEARDRLGGRVYTKSLSQNLYLDLGGQWIGPTQERMYALCEELGVGYFETYNEGKNILDLKGKIRTYSGVIPKMDPVSLINLDWIIRKLESLASQIPIENPWTHPKSDEFDSVTLGYFIKKNAKTASCYEVIKVGCETIFASELDEISLLHALFYIKSGTSLDCLINVKDGAQQHRIEGGMQTLAEKMAAPFRERIQFSTSVSSVEYQEDGVTVSGKGFEIQAKKLILAVPPPLLAQIQFNPPLPLAKRQLLDRYAMGLVVKCFMIYDRPFWREDKFSGQAVADDSSPFQTLFDCSPKNASHGIILGFSIGDRARQLMTLPEESRAEEMKQVLTRYFGTRAKDSTHYQDYCMSDEQWSKGCYAGLMPTGAWTGFRDAYRTPMDPLYFAGTEAATRWHGYIEGAVLAGEKAASAIIKKVNVSCEK